ncbi:MAG: septum formation protein Maf [Lachnospiraceae bacterium]|nr:septum formation protein Maf [Lachnospiraceae bacterium]
MKYILASGSPRRKEILTRMGLEYEILVSEVSEAHGELPPPQIVLELSRRKAEAAAALVKQQGREEEYCIIAADTLVAVDGEVLGKPADRNASRAMIRRISGRAHQVYTGVTLITLPREKSESFYVGTDVYVKPMSEEEIQAYADTGEGDDKAGAYAIQGMFGRYIERYDGDYDNVVGLPAAALAEHLGKFAVKN